MQEYAPTVFENYVADVQVDNKRVELTLWDTTGREESNHPRPFSHPCSHVILTWFAVDQPDTVDNAVEEWVPEIIHFCSQPRLPYIFAGRKADLRRQELTLEALRRAWQRSITTRQGREVAQCAAHWGWGHLGSARTGEGVGHFPECDEDSFVEA